MSIHDDLLAEGVPSLMEVQSDVGPPKILYFSPDAVKGVEVKALITDEEYSEEVNSETGELILRERAIAKVMLSEFAEMGITEIQYGSKMQLKTGDIWHIDTATSKWGNVLITLGLVRKPLLRKSEIRRSGS